MLISVLKSSGALLAAGGAPYYGQSRPADSVPVRSSTRVQVCFYDDNGNPTLLDAAVGTLTFSAQPVAGDLFTVGAITYKAVATLTGAANEVFLGANLTGFIANLIGAVNASTTTPETPGTTYGVGTVQNTLAGATAGPGSTVVFTAWQADASGNTVATTTTSAHASFGGATLSGADILNLDIKPTGEYDANFTFTTPVFTAPANPANGCYTGTLTTSSTAGNTLLDPNNPGGGTSSAIEPDAVTLMVQLRWGPASATLPARSNKWSINLTNSVGNGAEGVTVDPPSLTLAAVETAVAQAGKAAAQWPYAYANYGAMAAGAVEAAIAGVAPSPATQNFFSVYEPTSVPPVFTRNPACPFSWPSYVSCWNSANADGSGGTRGCVTMVTPTEGVTNHHFVQPYQAGVEHVFLGTDGALYTLTVATSEQIGATDIQLVTFSAAAPAAVGVASVLAPGVPATVLPAGTPLVSTNQGKQAIITQFLEVTDGDVYVNSATGSLAAWTQTPPAIVGDSDCPTFAPLAGQLLLLFTYTDGGSGPSFSDNLAAINAALAPGTSLSVMPLNTLGTAAVLNTGTQAGQIPVLNAEGQIDPGLLPGNQGTSVVYSEQTWDGTANVAVNPATTVLRLTTGTPGTQHTITLPTAPANGQTLEIVVPPSTGTPATDPVTGGAVQFKVTPANLSIAADPNYTRVFHLIAGTGGWAFDKSLVRQNTSASFTSVSTPRADFSLDVIFEDGTTIHGTEGTAFGFALMAINGAAQFTPVPLGPGESARLNAAGTALEAFAAAQYVPVPANSSAAGVAGQWSSDDSYLYYYGATKWLRVAGSTF